MTLARESLVDQASASEVPRQGIAYWYTPGLSDGLGDRLLMFDNSSSVPLELLRFPRALAESHGFEHALRNRLEDLKDFTHDAISRVRAVQWIGTGEGLALVSNHTPGRRLSETFSETRGQAYAVELVRQLTPLLAALEQHGPGFAHSVINADRVVITEDGRLVLVEHVLGSAVASLHWPAAQLRSAFGIAVPGDDPPILDGRTDVFQLAFVALSVVLGRRVNPSESSSQAERLIAEVCRPGLRREPVSPWFRRWLEQALRIGGSGFTSANEAHMAFHQGLPDDVVALPPAPPLALPVSSGSEPVSPGPHTRVADPDPLANEPLFLDEKTMAAPPAAPAARVVRMDDWTERTPSPAAAPQVTPPSVPAPSILTPPPVSPLLSQALPLAPGPHTPSSTAAAPASGAAPPPKPRRDWKLAALIALVIAEAVVIGALLALRPLTSWRQLFTATPATSPIVIDYSQPGAQVLVDGKPAGFTPFTIIPGSGKKVSVQPPAAQTTAGTAAPNAAPGAAAAAAGAATAVDVTSDPPGARVAIDGKAAGSTPLVVPVSPGSHEVVVSNGGSSATRTLRVTAGTTASFVATLSTAPGAGWMTIASPVELQVLENGSVVGTTSAARVMLPAGHHDLVVSNSALGFEAPLRVEIPAGKSISVTMPVPNGSVSLNALPWANVSIDGKEYGTTPVANVELPIGNHEVVWRHPQLGERRQTVTVTVKTPLRLVMDFRK